MRFPNTSDLIHLRWGNNEATFKRAEITPNLRGGFCSPRKRLKGQSSLFGRSSEILKLYERSKHGVTFIKEHLSANVKPFHLHATTPQTERLHLLCTHIDTVDRITPNTSNSWTTPHINTFHAPEDLYNIKYKERTLIFILNHATIKRVKYSECGFLHNIMHMLRFTVFLFITKTF